MLESGKTFLGVNVAETEATLTLLDKHVLAKADIEEQSASPLSTMPEGLEKRLTQDEFIDLVAFLASLNQSPKP